MTTNVPMVWPISCAVPRIITVLSNGPGILSLKKNEEMLQPWKFMDVEKAVLTAVNDPVPVGLRS